MIVSLYTLDKTFVKVVDDIHYNTFEELPQTLQQVVSGSDSDWRPVRTVVTARDQITEARRQSAAGSPGHEGR